MLKDMFKKTYTLIDTKYSASKGNKEKEPSIPQGLWRKCNKCGQPIYVEDVMSNHYVCPKCGGYMIERGSKLTCADQTCGYAVNKPKEQAI